MTSWDRGGKAAPSRGRVGPAVVRAAGIVLSVIAVAILVGTVDLDQTANQLRNASAAPLIGAVVLVFAQLAIVTVRWSVLLPATPSGRISWPPLVRPVALGYLGNFILPARLGELVRAAYVSTRWGIGLAPTLGSVVLERVIDTSVLGVLALGLAVALGVPPWIIQVAAAVAAVALAVLIILATGLILPLSRWLARRTAAVPAAIGRTLVAFLAGAGVERRQGILPAAGLSAVLWVVEGSVYWLAARSLGIDVGLAEAFLVAAITVLATAIPAAPAYVGTFELAVTAAAAAVGVDTAAGLAWGLVAHVVTVTPLAVAGIVALLTSGEGLGELLRDAEAAEQGPLDQATPPGASST